MARRWVWGLLLVATINLWGLRIALGRDDISRDTDTAAIVAGVRATENQLSWFISDWPLKNGFYRPFPSLAFAFDVAVHGNDVAAYRLTNWFVAFACSVLLIWFVWELFHNYLVAVISGALFAGWQTELISSLRLDVLCWIVGAGLLASCFLVGRGKRIDRMLAGGATFALGYELVFGLAQLEINSRSLAWRIVDWPPGRTASLMVLFGLISLAAYCRSERSRLIGWQIVSVLAMVAALCCYEQAVVLFACLLGCSLMLRLQNIVIRWGFHIAPVALTLVYVLMHKNYLSVDSAYRLQQSRSTSGGIRDIFVWLAPITQSVRMLLPSFGVMASEGLAVLFVSNFWTYLFGVFINGCNLGSIAKAWNWPLVFGLVGSVGCYSVLAFQHPFAHYYYLSACFRALYVVGLGLMIWRLVGIRGEAEFSEQRRLI
ncbi:MAG: hypothetical protein U0R49_04690 [Fimbriimonadales bacterium]